MSAAASGFPVSYRVIPPTSADLNGIESGARLHQKGRLHGSAQPPSAQWYIKSVGEEVVIQPLRGLWVYDPKRLTPSMVRSNFQVYGRRVC